jgi:hypothetical protein
MSPLIRWLAAILLLSVGANAAAARADIDAYLAASKEFELLSSQAATSGAMPRLSDLEAAKLLEVLGNEDLFRSRSYAMEDLDGLMDVCGKANALNMSYMLFGAKEIEPARDATRYAQRIQMLAIANTLTYQDEIFLLTPFLVRCMAVQLPLISSFFEALPPGEKTDGRRQGMKGMRDNVFSIYVGALSNVADERIAERHRRHLLASLAETSNTYGAALAPQRRKDLLRMIDSVEHRLPVSLRDQLGRIAAAMRDTACSSLCGL